MAKPISSGTLLHRRSHEQIEVLLVHPSGSYNKKSPFSIPKGLPNAGEDLESAARRETLEETGIVAEALTPLGSIDYKKSRKTVFAFGGPAPANAVPRCASWEVDRAEFVTIDRARELLHPDQQPFLDRLVQSLGDGGLSRAD